MEDKILLIYCATPARLTDRMEKIKDFVIKRGHGPFHPFQAFERERFEDGVVGRDKTIEFCCRAILICDEFWLFGISEGTLIELCYNLGSRKPKPIKVFLDEFDKKWQTEYKKLKDEFGDPLSKIKKIGGEKERNELQRSV